MDERTCSYPDCGGKVSGIGLCVGHYNQQYRGKPLTPILRGLTVEQRFWIKVSKTEACWQWLGAVGGHTYSNFWDGEKTRRAHTFSYELHTGEKVPRGMHLDHLCRNRTCVNPAHLEVVTPAENTRRGLMPLISRYQNIDQTHCKHGHPLSGENLYVQPKTGYRYCRTCNRRRTRISDANRRARLNAEGP